MPFSFGYTGRFEEIEKRLKKKDPQLALELSKKIGQIVQSNEETIEHYKNLNAPLSVYKRVHVGSFVFLFFLRSAENHERNALLVRKIQVPAHALSVQIHRASHAPRPQFLRHFKRIRIVLERHDQHAHHCFFRSFHELRVFFLQERLENDAGIIIQPAGQRRRENREAVGHAERFEGRVKLLQLAHTLLSLLAQRHSFHHAQAFLYFKLSEKLKRFFRIARLDYRLEFLQNTLRADFLELVQLDYHRNPLRFRNPQEIQQTVEKLAVVHFHENVQSGGFERGVSQSHDLSLLPY